MRKRESHGVGKVSAAGKSNNGPPWREAKEQICRINRFHFKCYIGRSPFGFFAFQFHFREVSALVFDLKCRP